MKFYKLYFLPPIINSSELNDKELVFEIAHLTGDTEKNIFVSACKETKKIDKEKIEDLWEDFYFVHNILPKCVKTHLRQTHRTLVTNALKNYRRKPFIMSN